MTLSVVISCYQISSTWKAKKPFFFFFFKFSSPWILPAAFCSCWVKPVILLLEALWVILAMAIVTTTLNQLEQISKSKDLVLRSWHLCCTHFKGFYSSRALIWSQGLQFSGGNWTVLSKDLKHIFWFSFRPKEFSLYAPTLLCDVN